MSIIHSNGFVFFKFVGRAVLESKVLLQRQQIVELSQSAQFDNWLLWFCLCDITIATVQHPQYTQQQCLLCLIYTAGFMDPW